MVELTVNDIEIELPPKSNIKFTKQISDIFDLSQISVSYTNSFEFEKTPGNSQAMQQLGISGDSSTIPYTKNRSNLKVNGFDIVSEGWFNVSGTDSNYKGSIIDGMVDFFRAIENKTMGKDLDLSNFNHDKTLESVIASFSNQYYNYIIADYGGKNMYNDGINIDYLAPCFSVRKLWELIFSTFNFNCDYTNLSYIEGLYITYPKDVYEEQTNDVIATMNKGFYLSQKKTIIAGVSYPTSKYFWDSSVIDEGSLVDNWKYIIPETTSYNFDLKFAAYMLYTKPGRYGRRLDASIEVLKNGVVIGSIISDLKESGTVGDERELNFNLACNQGDIIEISIYAPRNMYFNGAGWFISNQWHHNNTNLLISKTDLGTTVLENELKDFLIKDFIKEQIWRTGLTPILNKETNTVEFITLDSRIDFDNAQDMSHTFVERTNEVYTNDYAQKNIFKLKKNVDTDLTGDGYLYVYNRNIEDEKTIAQSKIYAPDKKIVTTFIGFNTNQYKIWETETKINDDDEIEVNYKGLSGRFYFIRKENKSGTFKIISEKLVSESVVSEIPVGINTDTLFEEAVYKNYSEYQKIFENFRIHTISQAMAENDFIGLDLTRPVFFKQENAYYICNKITFSEGQKSIGEYIKINKL